MGFDFENILGTSGEGLAETYEDTVAEVIYFDEPIEDLEDYGPLPPLTSSPESRPRDF